VWVNFSHFSFISLESAHSEG